MKAVALMLSLIAIAAAGCSWVTTSERASLTLPQSREEYVTTHPDGAYNAYIRNGEITSGMNTHEILASWGFPNAYLASKKDAREHWIYYVQNEDSKSYMIYTLNFSGEVLQGWGIDIKRFGDYSYRGSVVATQEMPAEESRTFRKKN